MTLTRSPKPNNLLFALAIFLLDPRCAHGFAHDHTDPVLDPLFLDPTGFVYQLANVDRRRLGGQSQQGLVGVCRSTVEQGQGISGWGVGLAGGVRGEVRGCDLDGLCLDL